MHQAVLPITVFGHRIGNAGWPSHVSDDLEASPALSFEDISEWMSGNLCRCSCYANIVDAILDAAG